MKNLFKSLMIIAIVAIIGLSMAGCVTATTIGGAGNAHGLFSGGGAKAAATEGYTEIASYLSILNLFDTGYDDYAKKVKDAEASGKKIVSVTTFIFIGNKITAYAK
ncbi:hypothetical protein [Treponema sp. R6D11]